jgi:hypothetical protein
MAPRQQKTIQRDPRTVCADLSRIQLDNPLVRAGLCRVLDKAVKKVIEEDRGQSTGNEAAEAGSRVNDSSPRTKI